MSSDLNQGPWLGVEVGFQAGWGTSAIWLSIGPDVGFNRNGATEVIMTAELARELVEQLEWAIEAVEEPSPDPLRPSVARQS